MLGNLSKLADGTFVLGFVLPVIIGLVAGAYAFQDAPLFNSILPALAADKSEEKIRPQAARSVRLTA